MNNSLNVKNILKEIGNCNLDLCYVKQHMYWYFLFDDGNMFETKTVLTTSLNTKSLQEWILIGTEFLQEIQNGNQKAESQECCS